MKKIVLVGISALLLFSHLFTQAQPGLKKDVSGFVYMTSLGILTGVGELKFEERRLPNNKNFIINLHQLIAYQFNPYITTGMGVGVDVWKRTAFIPVYAHFDVNFIDKPITPNWFINVGYAFKWYVSSQPERVTKVIHAATTGFHAETGLGVKVKIKENLEFLLAAHYKLQQSDLKYSVIDPNVTNYPSISTNRAKNMLYHFVGLKVGVLYW